MMSKAVDIFLTVYYLGVAVTLAGMVLTPTKACRERDEAIRERSIHDGIDEAIYFMLKFTTAVRWPWLLARDTKRALQRIILQWLIRRRY